MEFENDKNNAVQALNVFFSVLLQEQKEQSNEIVNKKMPFLRENGIHQVSREQWDIFRRSFGIWPSRFELQMDSFFVLSRDSYYMFFTGKEGKKYLFDGGLRIRATHELEYYYENLLKFISVCKKILDPRQKMIDYVSSIIKKLGFDGRIHGCIIDVDFYSHVFVNPIDFSITPYRAKNIKDKIVYRNIFSFFNAAGYKELCLLSLRIKDQKNILKQNANDTYSIQRHKTLVECYDAVHKLDALISKETSSPGSVSVSDTRMYRLSKRMTLLQKLQENHTLGFWDDSYFEISNSMIDKT